MQRTTITLDERAGDGLARRLAGRLHTSLVGEVFAENALAAALVCDAMGCAPEAIVAGIAECRAPAGRFEIAGAEPAVVIDYAHTEDALARTLRTARRLVRGTLWLIMGAGGGAMPEKRRPMGEIAGELADRVVLTSDNPRDEDPAQIAADLAEGVAAADKTPLIELDRAAAIRLALDAAGPADLIVIAGKGHERGQTVRGTVLPHSDHDVVAAWRAARA